MNAISIILWVIPGETLGHEEEWDMDRNGTWTEMGHEQDTENDS